MQKIFPVECYFKCNIVTGKVKIILQAGAVLSDYYWQGKRIENVETSIFARRATRGLLER
ncbi:hypothetical protein [Dyadobacter koreensis]|uniref:hypothetical protein n=1 Tax=Dyadobacter koreensis TaxID=408657 RepID=UPI000B838473|nr:hypothetical protein [Dyadobacter koreensis]